MDQKAFEKFLRENSPQAYKKYMRGKSCIAVGWTFLPVGILATVGGGILYSISRDIHRDEFTKCANNLNQSLKNTRCWDEYGYLVQPEEIRTDANMWFFPDYNMPPTQSMTSAERAWYSACLNYMNQAEIIAGIGSGLMCVGGSLTFVSIPLLGVGYKVRNNAHKNYNVEPKTKRQYSLNLQSNQTGIGLALNF